MSWVSTGASPTLTTQTCSGKGELRWETQDALDLGTSLIWEKIWGKPLKQDDLWPLVCVHMCVYTCAGEMLQAPEIPSRPDKESKMPPQQGKGHQINRPHTGHHLFLLSLCSFSTLDTDLAFGYVASVLSLLLQHQVYCWQSHIILTICVTSIHGYCQQQLNGPPAVMLSGGQKVADVFRWGIQNMSFMSERTFWKSECLFGLERTSDESGCRWDLF